MLVMQDGNTHKAAFSNSTILLHNKIISLHLCKLFILPVLHSDHHICSRAHTYTNTHAHTYTRIKHPFTSKNITTRMMDCTRVLFRQSGSQKN